MHIIAYQGSDNGEDAKIGCKAPGNPRCNPESWKFYGGYSNACCSEEEKCTINEGDCNTDTECFGSLICKANSCPTSADPSKNFHERASCCQQPSGTYLLGKSFNDVHCILRVSNRFFKANMVNRYTSSFFQPTPLKEYLT